MAIRCVFTTVETLAPRDLLWRCRRWIVAQNRNTPQKRARGALERARWALRNLLPKTEYNDKINRAYVADFALTLSDRPEDGPLLAAFKEFRLDPNDPVHWRILLNELVKIHFDEPAAPRGAPQKSLHIRAPILPIVHPLPAATICKRNK
jgi:hypothetical protein